jgi:hypothetical protein
MTSAAIYDIFRIVFALYAMRSMVNTHDTLNYETSINRIIFMYDLSLRIMGTTCITESIPMMVSAFNYGISVIYIYLYRSSRIVPSYPL